MSNRTIIEINHDFGAKIKTDQAAFGAALSEALRTNADYAWDALRGFGATRIVTVRDTDERNVYVNGRRVE